MTFEGNEMYRAVFEAVPSPCLLTTPDLVILDANQARLNATGHRREEIVGRSLFEAFPANPDVPGSIDVARRVRASLERVRDSGVAEAMGVERYDVPDRDGSGFTERYWSVVNLPIPDEAGRTALLLHRVEDVTDVVEGAAGSGGLATDLSVDLLARSRELQELNRLLREAHDRLETRALHDPLTGLLVRSVLIEQLTHALAGLSRHPRTVAVLFIDLDRLKQLNDTHGHAAGDDLIRYCSDRLRRVLRPSDAIARFGGDEFVVLLDDLTEPRDAEVVARRLLDALRGSTTLPSGLLVRPNASIGVAVTDSAKTSADTLISRADAAMYRAKQGGGDRYEVFDEVAYAEISARRRLEADLTAATSSQQLRLHYQPIVDVTDGALHAVEAVLRWQHPTRGLLPAAEFIEIAEASGLIIDVGAWVVQEACRQLAEWDAVLGDRAPRRMFVNLSVAELAGRRVDEQLAEAAAAAQVDPRRFVLELTETGIVQEERAISDALGPLLDRGCELAIDDFGTGHSSLTRLVQLPASILKIDRSFVHAMHRDHASAAVVAAVLLLAHNLRLTVVAEGVEDAETLQGLRDLGCPYAQGYHIARPQSAEDLVRLLSAPEQAITPRG